MDPRAIPAISVGSLIKKIVEANPDLDTQDIAQVIRQATRRSTEISEGFNLPDVIDEAKALELARELQKTRH